MNNRQAVEEIFAKTLFADFNAQVTIRGGHHSDIELARTYRSDWLDFMRLQDAQQLALHGERHLADFIEKDRAALGMLEKPGTSLVRASESPFHVAEHLALGQRFRNSRAITDDEWALPGWGELV